MVKRYILYKWKVKDRIPVFDDDFENLNNWEEKYRFEWIQISGSGLDEGNYMVYDLDEKKMIIVFKVGGSQS
jgi:hypothetical protein